MACCDARSLQRPWDVHAVNGSFCGQRNSLIPGTPIISRTQYQLGIDLGEAPHLATPPYIPYILLANNPVHTKTFKSSNSVAVRLPKGSAIPANVEVALEKSSDTVTIRTLRNPVAAKKALLDMLDELQKLPKPPTVQKRDPFEFPDRPGL